MKYVLVLSAVLLIFTSCEKNIDFNLKNADDLLVVDAQIENGMTPTVSLTKSFDYFNTINPQLLLNSFVHNAEVTLSNGTRTHKLKEYAVPLGGGYVAYYYGIDSANLATAFTGEFNKKYTLTIKAEGKVYEASTNIPLLAKDPDSLWFKRAPLNPDTNKRVLMTRTTDPPGLGNYIRYFTKTNRANFYPGTNSVFDDAVIDGTTYEIQVDPGVDRNRNIP